MRVVLASIGSLGDLHPFIAIGLSLKAMGVSVVLAVPADGVAKARAAGLDAMPILPSYASICERLGMTQAEVAGRIIADTNFVIDEILMPSLAHSVASLDALAAGADVMAGSIFTFAAGIVAEKQCLPFVPVILQPMTLFSTFQPPAASPFEIMRHAPGTSIERSWNAALYGLVKFVLRRRYTTRINDVRREYGLAPSRNSPLFDHGATTETTLCCWSSALGPLPADAPHHAHQVGFPFFDSEHGGDAEIAPELATFLDDGPPPLVFSLGSVAVASAGNFYSEAMAASRALGKRAVLLTGEQGPPRCEDGCLIMSYAPHSALFPRAEAIVHHGGIGTVGQALRAGRPQIIVPHFGDQFDNAARLVRLGLGGSIRRGNFTASNVVQILGKAIADPLMQRTAEGAAEKIAKENGASAAAEQIVAACAISDHPFTKAM
jgi:UDP:flavonoid glycosyltransferase YjiC (YdhE family)